MGQVRDENATTTCALGALQQRRVRWPKHCQDGDPDQAHAGQGPGYASSENEDFSQSSNSSVSGLRGLRDFGRAR